MKLTLDIEPKPQSRPRFTRFGRAYDDPKMKAWRNSCQLLIANQYMGQSILEGALRARLRFYIKPPQYLSKVKKYHQALYDSMSGIVFKDDGQIALHDVGKFYSLNPRIEIEIEEMKWNG